MTARLLLPILLLGVPTAALVSSRAAAGLAAARPATTTLSMSGGGGSADALLEQARRLREEAERMSEELQAQQAANPSRTVTVEPATPRVVYKPRPVSELASALSGLPVGQSEAFAQKLADLKAEGALELYASERLEPSRTIMDAFRAESRIDPDDLRLEGPAVDFKIILGAVLVVSTVSALTAGSLGGGVGFVLGYVSALTPVAFVGLGVVAPGIITAVVQGFQARFDDAYRRSVACHTASTFLVAYATGASVLTMADGAVTKVPTYFDRLSAAGTAALPPAKPSYDDPPEGEAEAAAAEGAEDDGRLRRGDVDALAVRALAGAVGECILAGKSTGASAGLVLGLQDAMTVLRPRMSDEEQQNETRWAAVTAFRILKKNQRVLERMTDLFLEGRSIEEVIAEVEGLPEGK